MSASAAFKGGIQDKRAGFSEPVQVISDPASPSGPRKATSNPRVPRDDHGHPHNQPCSYVFVLANSVARHELRNGVARCASPVDTVLARARPVCV